MWCVGVGVVLLFFSGSSICFFTDLRVASLPGLHAFGTIPMIRPIALGG